MRPPPEDVVANDGVGGSPGLRSIASLGLPGASGSSGTSRNACRSQLRRAAAASGKALTACPCASRGAGTDQPRVQRPQDASQVARQVRIDKGPTPTIKCRHRRSLMRERTGNVVRNQGFPCHSCPRNCKRRARATTPLEASGKAVTGGDPRARRPAVDSDACRAGCLGAARFARGTRIASSPHGAARVTLIDPTGLAQAAASGDAATIYICVTCQRAGMPESEPRPGAVLADATVKAAEGTGVTVRRVRCLANCSRGPSAAMRCNGSWTYIFGGLGTDCAVALIDGARLLATAADGLLPWRGRPEPLKRGLIARIPPLDFEEDCA